MLCGRIRAALVGLSGPPPWPDGPSPGVAQGALAETTRWVPKRILDRARVATRPAASPWQSQSDIMNQVVDFGPTRPPFATTLCPSSDIPRARPQHQRRSRNDSWAARTKVRRRQQCRSVSRTITPYQLLPCAALLSMKPCQRLAEGHGRTRKITGESLESSPAKAGLSNCCPRLQPQGERPHRW